MSEWLQRVCSLAGIPPQNTRNTNEGFRNGRDKILRRAIDGRKVAELRYEGHVGYLRVEPHVYGRNARGEFLLLCYDLSDSAASGDGEAWRTLAVADIISVGVTARPFSCDRPPPWEEAGITQVIALA